MPGSFPIQLMINEDSSDDLEPSYDPSTASEQNSDIDSESYTDGIGTRRLRARKSKAVGDVNSYTKSDVEPSTTDTTRFEGSTGNNNEPSKGRKS